MLLPYYAPSHPRLYNLYTTISLWVHILCVPRASMEWTTLCWKKVVMLACRSMERHLKMGMLACRSLGRHSKAWIRYRRPSLVAGKNIYKKSKNPEDVRRSLWRIPSKAARAATLAST